MRSGRPVSGEILAASRAGGGYEVNAAREDVVDAEYETLRGPDAAGAKRYSALSSAPSAITGLDILRGDGCHAGSRLWRRGAFGALGLAGVLVIWIVGGQTMFGLPAKSGTEAAALDISTVRSRLETIGGRTVLVVDGAAVNRSGRETPLPDLFINIVNGKGEPMHYLLGTNGVLLSAGERFAFFSRLAAPKEGVHSVSVTFRPGK